MDFIKETLQTPVKGKYDVIIVGAGPAGCGAARACGEKGLKTLILDRFNCLGGAWTVGFMNPLFDHANKNGFIKELKNALQSKNKWGGFANMSFHYEYMKVILERTLQDLDVDMLFNTTFSKAITEGNRVVGVVVENIEGRSAYLADFVMDCTGDGAVAADAGCAFEIGENGDYTECQAMTLMFLVGNIPEKWKNGGMIFENLNRAYEKEGLDIPFTRPYLIPVPDTRFGVVQFTHMYNYNPLSAKDITKANIEGRKQMMEAFEAVKKHDADLGALELIASSITLGVRESRRIIGEYTVTTDDIIEGTHFEDAVCDATFNVDVHTKSNKGQRYYDVKPYQIPLRALLPKGWDGIVVAGRCISGSRDAMASYRVTGNCCQMAENAGYILAYAKEKNIPIAHVQVSEVLEKGKHIL